MVCGAWSATNGIAIALEPYEPTKCSAFYFGNRSEGDGRAGLDSRERGVTGGLLLPQAWDGMVGPPIAGKNFARLAWRSPSGVPGCGEGGVVRGCGGE